MRRYPNAVTSVAVTCLLVLAVTVLPAYLAVGDNGIQQVGEVRDTPAVEAVHTEQADGATEGQTATADVAAASEQAQDQTAEQKDTTSAAEQPEEPDMTAPEGELVAEEESDEPVLTAQEGEDATISRAGTTSWSSSAGGTQYAIALADSGLYQFDIAGAKGGNMYNYVSGWGYGGAGGTTTAVTPVDATTLHVVTGGQGAQGSTNNNRAAGGVNGGGNGGRRADAYGGGGGGGGATHVATQPGMLSGLGDDAICLVAGGGGGARQGHPVGVGGGATGSYNGGTQTSGYARGQGQAGQDAPGGSGNRSGGGGGGGGYWGGYRNNDGGRRAGGGGGSGYLSDSFVTGTKAANGGSVTVGDDVTVATTTQGGGTGAGDATITYVASIITLDSQDASETGTSVLYAKPQESQYFGSYSVNGLADETTQIEIPKRESGSTYFDGYYTAPNHGGTRYIDSNGTIEASTYELGTKTLYAAWSNKVTFDDGGVGASGMPEDLTLKSGQKVSAPASDPTASGRTFRGWSSKANDYVPFDFTKAIEADTTIYAFWTPSVVFDMKGHGDQVATLFPTKNTIIAAPDPEPTATGYTFGGWFKDENCENPWDFASDTVGETNITLYAGWTVNTYTVDYVVGGKVVGTDGFTYGVPQALSTAESLGISKEGWTFAGWRRYDELEVDYSDGENVENLLTDTGTVELYAVWSRDISFVSGLAQSLSPQSSTTVPQLTDDESMAAVTTPSLDAVDGWSSVGWLSSKVAASSADVAAGSTLTPQDVTTFYGLYSRDATVTFDGNGADSGSVDPMSDVQRMNASGELTSVTLTLPANGFVREGYAFAGWDLGAAGSAYTYKPAATSSPDLVAHAQWTGSASSGSSDPAATSGGSLPAGQATTSLPMTGDPFALVGGGLMLAVLCVAAGLGMRAARTRTRN